MTRGEILSIVNKRLHRSVPWILFGMWIQTKEPYVDLDGSFDLDDLEEIVNAMKEIKSGAV